MGSLESSAQNSLDFSSSHPVFILEWFYEGQLCAWCPGGFIGRACPREETKKAWDDLEVCAWACIQLEVSGKYDEGRREEHSRENILS